MNLEDHVRMLGHQRRLDEIKGCATGRGQGGKFYYWKGIKQVKPKDTKMN